MPFMTEMTEPSLIIFDFILSCLKSAMCWERTTLREAIVINHMVKLGGKASKIFQILQIWDQMINLGLSMNDSFLSIRKLLRVKINALFPSKEDIYTWDFINFHAKCGQFWYYLAINWLKKSTHCWLIEILCFPRALGSSYVWQYFNLASSLMYTYCNVKKCQNTNKGKARTDL